MRYKNNYIHNQSKKEDKYEGLFSKSQEIDLNGGINDIVVEKVSSAEFNRRKQEQRIVGTGINMHNPYGFD